MIKLGDYNTLTAIRRADQGFYLEGDDWKVTNVAAISCFPTVMCPMV